VIANPLIAPSEVFKFIDSAKLIDELFIVLYGIVEVFISFHNFSQAQKSILIVDALFIKNVTVSKQNQTFLFADIATEFLQVNQQQL